MYHIKRGKENKPYFEELAQHVNKDKESVVIFPANSRQV